MKKIILITSVLAVLLTACGGASNSSSDSATGNAATGSSSSPNSVPSAPTQSEVRVALEDPMSYPLTDIEVWVSGSNEAANALALTLETSGMSLLPPCENKGQKDCVDQDSQIVFSCTDEVRQVVVTHEGEVLKQFELSCKYGQLVYQVPNKDLVLAFSVNSATDELIEHKVDLNSYQLLEFQRFPAGQTPTKIITHPKGNMLYVLNKDDHNISTFHLSGLSGNVKEILPRVESAINPIQLYMHPNGQCLYTANNGLPGSISVYSVSKRGLLTLMPGISMGGSASPTALVVAPNDVDAYVATINRNEILHYTIDAATCNLTFVDKIRAYSRIGSMSINTDGSKLYAAGLTIGFLVSYDVNVDGSLNTAATLLNDESTFDTSNGQVLTIGHTDEGDITKITEMSSDLKEFDIDKSGTFAYSTNINDSTVQVYLVEGDCSLTPFFTTVQSGDSLGAVVNMNIPIYGRCDKAVYTSGESYGNEVNKSVGGAGE